MLFYSFFKTLIGKRLIFEVKNGLKLDGRLESVDSFLNMKICRILVTEPSNIALDGLEVCSLRGSCIKFIRMSSEDVNTEALLDASRFRISKSK